VAVIKSEAIQALTAAALALPGMLPTAAEATQLETSITSDFQYGHYQESDNRISVDIFQGIVSIPVSNSLEIQTTWVVDTFSGATPVLTMPASSAHNSTGASGINGVDVSHLAIADEPVVQVMTGASTRETRYGVDLGFSYILDDLTFHASANRSEEPDYLSHGYHTGVDWEFNQKFTTLSIGFGQNFDEIKPTTRLLNSKKTDYHAELGFSQVISKQSLLHAGINYTYSHGYLSNPYKKVFIQGNTMGSGLESGGFSHVFYENRPNNRDQWSMSIGYIQYVAALDGAIHFDYRFFADSWDISSHTFQAVYHQPIAKGWMLTPRVRCYSQTAANFYQSFYTAPRIDNTYSSDFRLAGFGTLSGGVMLTKEWQAISTFIETIKLELGFEYSTHAADLQLGGKIGTDVTDFNYLLFTSSLKIKF